MSSISHIRAPIATDELEPDLAISPTSPHVRRPQGPRANQFARVRLAACRSASLFGGALSSAVHRESEGRAWHDQFRVMRHRYAAVAGGRDAQSESGNHHGSYPVQGLRAGADRRFERPGTRDLQSGDQLRKKVLALAVTTSARDW